MRRSAVESARVLGGFMERATRTAAASRSARAAALLRDQVRSSLPRTEWAGSTPLAKRTASPDSPFTVPLEGIGRPGGFTARISGSGATQCDVRSHQDQSVRPRAVHPEAGESAPRFFSREGSIIPLSPSPQMPPRHPGRGSRLASCRVSPPRGRACPHRSCSSLGAAVEVAAARGDPARSGRLRVGAGRAGPGLAWVGKVGGERGSPSLPRAGATQG